MGRTIKYRKGRFNLELSGDLLDYWTRRLNAIAPATLRYVQDTVEQVEEDARNSWPVKTGRSKRAFKSHTVIFGGGKRIEGFVTNDATNPSDKSRKPYAVLITVAQAKHVFATTGKRLRPWRVSVMNPIEDAAEPLATLLATEAAALIANAPTGKAPRRKGRK